MDLRGDQVVDALNALEHRVLHDHARQSRVGILGYGLVILHGPDKIIPFMNLVTTAGDEYYSQMAIAGVSPASAATPTKASGMKLGTGTTTPSKSGSGAALGTYLSGSNAAFDSSFPATAAVTGTDAGWKATYQTTWAAGTATNSAISEVVIVNDSGTDATSTAANTYSRVLFSPTADKGSTQALTVVWNHVFLGS